MCVFFISNIRGYTPSAGRETIRRFRLHLHLYSDNWLFDCSVEQNPSGIREGHTEARHFQRQKREWFFHDFPIFPLAVREDVRGLSTTFRLLSVIIFFAYNFFVKASLRSPWGYSEVPTLFFFSKLSYKHHQVCNSLHPTNPLPVRVAAWKPFVFIGY